MTDVLGICESFAEGLVTVLRENGDRVEIPTADIVSGKPVPPRPSLFRRLDDTRVDRLALPGWPATETEPLGEWLLRASGGFSSRGNSVLALGDPAVHLADAVARTVDWYRERSLAPRAHVHPGSAPALAFVEAGWTSYESTSVLLGSVAKVLRRLGRSTLVEPVHAESLDPGWLATDQRAAAYGDDARRVLEAGEVTFVSIRDEDGAVVARGRGAFHDDWLGVSALWTEADRRGDGLGSAVLRALLDWGAERGATTTYVQVVESNPDARRLYETCGYEVHHRYEYLSLGSEGQGRQDGR